MTNMQNVIKLEGGPKHGHTVPEPEEQHATITEPITGFVWENGQPTEKTKKGYAIYQYFAEKGRAFWSHNEWVTVEG